MEELRKFILMYWQILSVVSSFMLFLVALKLWWHDIRYFMMRVSWSFPLFGGIARAGRKDHKLGQDGWYPVETQLCGGFYRHYNSFNKSPDYYEKCDDYLNKVDELGRKEKGLFLWLLIVGLILLEAVGFAYVLAPFMTKNASSNEQTMLAWFLAMLLSVAAVVLTELMGKEWHKNELMKKIREWWASDNGTNRKDLRPEKNISIDKTYSDNESPRSIQLLNRISANAKVTPSYTLTIITVLYIISLALGAYFIRSYTLEADLIATVNAGTVTSQDTGAQDPFAAMQSSVSANSSNDDKIEVPKEISDVNKKVDQKAENESSDDLLKANKITFVILSIIYVMIQIVGIYFGYAFSFSGKESKKAHQYTKGFNSAEELNIWLQLKRDLVSAEADNYLQRLQEKLSHRAVTSVAEQSALKEGLAERSFHSYLMRKKVREDQLNTPTAAPESAPLFTALQNNGTTATQIPVVTVPEFVTPVAEAVAVAPVNESPSVVTPKAFQLPPELADINITNLDDNDLQILAADFDLDLSELQKYRRLLVLKQKAGNMQK